MGNPKKLTDFDEVLKKYNLSQMEVKCSRVTYQRRAFVLSLNDQDWVFFDERGDLVGEGNGVVELDKFLSGRK